MGVRLIDPADLAVWCRMRRALWPDAAPRELIREAEAYFAGASPLEAVFLGVWPAGEAVGMLELSLRQSLSMSAGDYAIFVERPIATTMLALAFALFLLALKPLVFRGKKDWRSTVGLEGEQN